MQQTQLISEEAQAKIRESVEEAILSYGQGVECVEIKFFKEYGKLNLTVYIWKKEGISLDDCEAVHNIVSPSLDALDTLFPDEYVLNVSSSGLDRKIVTDDDFRRALDTDIEIVNADKSKVHGILISYDDEHIELETSGKKPQNIIISRKNTTKVQPYIRF